MGRITGSISPHCQPSTQRCGQGWGVGARGAGLGQAGTQAAPRSDGAISPQPLVLSLGRHRHTTYDTRHTTQTDAQTTARLAPEADRPRQGPRPVTPRHQGMPPFPRDIAPAPHHAPEPPTTTATTRPTNIGAPPITTITTTRQPSPQTANYSKQIDAPASRAAPAGTGSASRAEAPPRPPFACPWPPLPPCRPSLSRRRPR